MKWLFSDIGQQAMEGTDSWKWEENKGVLILEIYTR